MGFDALDMSRTDFRWLRTGLRGGLSVLFPNSPRLSTIPGRYEIALRSSGTTEVAVSILHKRQDPKQVGATLPLVFWFTANRYLNAQTARTDQRFQRMLKEFAAIYDRVGIQIGPVTYVDLSGPAAQQFTVVTPDTLSDLLRLSNGSDEQGLHFFMVEQFMISTGQMPVAGIVAGVSGGIPGPPAFPGLQHAGVAVSLLLIDELSWADTFAHEGGHYLGLYHSSERDGLAHDPLSDTPECLASADLNRNGFVEQRECVDSGADNLMFWSGGLYRQSRVTEDQKFVLMQNPSLQ